MADVTSSIDRGEEADQGDRPSVATPGCGHLALRWVPVAVGATAGPTACWRASSSARQDDSRPHQTGWTGPRLTAAATVRDQHSDVGVLVLSQHIEARAVAGLLDGRPAGIGYLLRERVRDLSEFVDACMTVATGGNVIDPIVAEQLLRARRHDDRLARLSGRETDVVRPTSSEPARHPRSYRAGDST